METLLTQLYFLVNPVAFSFDVLGLHFEVHWYGIIIVTGVLIAALIAEDMAKRHGNDPDHIWNMLIYVLILGIIGARLYHVFSKPSGGFVGWPYYRKHPIEIIAFWHGGFRGLGIYGAVIGGLLGTWLYTRHYKLNFFQWADYGIPGLLLAQALGRWGNYVNQELYGPPTSLPWGIKIDAAHRFGPYLDLKKYPVATTRFHPTFLYESIWDFVGFLLIYLVSRKGNDKLRNGDLVLMYLIYYPLGRFWVEMFRPDAWKLGTNISITTAQAISLVAIAVGAVGLYLRHRNWQPEPAAVPVTLEENGEGGDVSE